MQFLCMVFVGAFYFYTMKKIRSFVYVYFYNYTDPFVSIFKLKDINLYL